MMKHVWMTMLVLCVSGSVHAAERATWLIVVGAEGKPEYREAFTRAAQSWRRTAVLADADVVVIESHNHKQGQRERFQTAVAQAVRARGGPLWLVLVGHGTFDGRQGKFNLRGADVAADELQAWLAGLTRPLVLVNGASASAPFVKALAGPRRILISATKTGFEVNATRFSMIFANTMTDPAADLDHDGSVSLLEAFLVASRRVEATYTKAGRLASEHAILDDNGDGIGTPAKLYAGLRPTKNSKDAPVDGAVAHTVVIWRKR